MIIIIAVIGLILWILSQYQNTCAQAPGHCDYMTTENSSNKLGYADIYQLALNAGFTDANTAAAIALAESGGDPNAYNPETQAGAPCGQGSYGLWQIYRNAHPEFCGLDLTDPQLNANAAYKVFNEAGGSFRPWSTYKNGAYTKYLA